MVFSVVFLGKNHIIETVVRTLKPVKKYFKNTTFRGISNIQRFRGISNAHISSAIISQNLDKWNFSISSIR